MSPLDPKDRRRGGDSQRQPVLGPLVDLLTDLNRILSGDLPSGCVDDSFTIWQDDNDIYIDNNIKSLRNVDVDIALCDGKLLIRMGR